jgi:hypothetical protein
MRRMIRAAVSHVTNSILFNSAYPAVEKETYHRDVFVKCAKQLNYSQIVKRIQSDEELVKLFDRVVNILIIFHSFLFFYNSS